MTIRAPFTLLAILSFHLFYSPSLYAADDILLPPEHHGKPAATISNDDRSSADLNKALAPPKQSDEVQVQTYLRDDDKSKITEYSLHGHVFSIKVQPAGGLPAYYLDDVDGDGSFQRRIAGDYKPISPPMWIIKKF